MLFQVFVLWKFIKTSAGSTGFHLSTITFTANSHADNHFYRYIYNYYYCKYYYYYFHKCYTIWNRFFIRIRANVFYIQIKFTCKTPLLLFQIKTWFTEKNLSRKNYFLLSIWCSQVTSHPVWVDEIMGVMISIKMMNKN